MTDATTNTFRTGDPRLRWLFLDLNSYFASVEQELRPELRDRPMAVVPLLADTTCCIAASYEAKQYGVRTGTQVGEAKRLCPGIVLVEARHELYVDYHHRVVEAVESCLPVTSVMSIDEMACRLLGREQPLLAALELAREVKAAVRRKAGATLRCSVGLATNRYLSKVASDMEKPDGLVALTPDLLQDTSKIDAFRSLDWQTQRPIPNKLCQRTKTTANTECRSVVECLPETVVVEEHTGRTVYIGKRVLGLKEKGLALGVAVVDRN